MKKVISILFVFILLASSVFCFPADATYDTFLEEGFHSDYYYLICTDNNEIIFSKDADKQVKIASLTKIATASVVLSNVADLQSIVTVPQKNLDELKGTNSSTGGLKAGETYTVYNLLCCLLIESANDAATVLADYVSNGNRQDFIDKMNNLASDLGCKNTNFENVHGLDSDNHYSTASDVARLLKNAMNYPVFAEICSKITYKLPPSNLQEERTLTTTNKTMMSGYKDYYCRYITGGKTGSTSGAGQCLAVSATNNGYHYIAVALHGEKVDIDDDNVDENGAFVDCKNMLNWAFNNLRLVSIAESAKVVGEVKVKYGKSDYVSLSPSDTAFSLMPKTVDTGSLLIRVVPDTVPEYINAPVEKGQIICKGEVLYAGEVIMTIDLVASVQVKRSLLSTIGTGLVNLFKSAAFKVLLIIAVAVIIAILILRKRGFGGKGGRKVLDYNDFFKTGNQPQGKPSQGNPPQNNQPYIRQDDYSIDYQVYDNNQDDLK